MIQLRAALQEIADGAAEAARTDDGAAPGTAGPADPDLAHVTAPANVTALVEETTRRRRRAVAARTTATGIGVAAAVAGVIALAGLVDRSPAPDPADPDQGIEDVDLSLCGTSALDLGWQAEPGIALTESNGPTLTSDGSLDVWVTTVANRVLSGVGDGLAVVAVDPASLQVVGVTALTDPAAAGRTEVTSPNGGTLLQVSERVQACGQDGAAPQAGTVDASLPVGGYRIVAARTVWWADPATGVEQQGLAVADWSAFVGAEPSGIGEPEDFDPIVTESAPDSAPVAVLSGLPATTTEGSVLTATVTLENRTGRDLSGQISPAEPWVLLTSAREPGRVTVLSRPTAAARAVDLAPGGQEDVPVTLVVAGAGELLSAFAVPGEPLSLGAGEFSVWLVSTWQDATGDPVRTVDGPWPLTIAGAESAAAAPAATAPADVPVTGRVLATTEINNGWLVTSELDSIVDFDLAVETLVTAGFTVVRESGTAGAVPRFAILTTANYTVTLAVSNDTGAAFLADYTITPR